jgi:caffeoyl-CoA O-methyltransferase
MTVPEDLEAFATAIGPQPDEILSEMEDHAAETGFPTVGPAVGGWLQQLAGLVGAERVFEFGSGFGYSAYWFARGLSTDGEIVLTEIDTEELEAAREYLERGGVAERATFELGDAIETVERHAGPFDIVLIDNEKHRYVEAFEAIRPKVPVGGVIVADNAIEGPFEFETIRRLYLDNERLQRTDDRELKAARGIEAYLDHVGSIEAFETTLLPLGEGLTVSRRVR